MRVPLRQVASLLFLALLAPACSGGGGHHGGSAASGSAAAPTTPTPATTYPILAGAARTDCTPPVGAPLGGYGGGPRRPLDATTIPQNLAAAFGTIWKPNPSAYNTLFAPSTGKHDAISAKALVLEKNGERFAIMSCDFIGISRKARDAITALIQAGAGIAPDHVLLCATHTHSGPAAVVDKMFWEMAAMDIFDQRIFDMVTTQAAQAAIDAAARLEPAKIGFHAEDESSVQHNRRGHPGVFDPSLTTMRVDRPDGTPIALAINFAIHGICLDENSMVFTADLQGYCEREVEAQLGGGAVCLFLNANEGDVNPVDYDFTGAEHIGKTIAAHALTIAQTAAANAQADLPLAVAWEDAQFAYKPALRADKALSSVPGALAGQFNIGIFSQIFGALFVELDDDWCGRTYPFQALRVGDAVFCAVPGEPITNVGLGIKAGARALGFARPLVVGLANDHLGYITDQVEFDLGGYEAFLTLFGRDESTFVTDAVLRQAAKIKP